MDGIEKRNIKRWFVEYSKMVMDGGYTIDDRNREVMAQVFDTITESIKGACLIGNTGCGKTMLFELLIRVIHPESPIKFIKVSVTDTVLDFNRNGHSAFLHAKDKNIIYDDLGTEPVGKYYGDSIDVFAQLILRRYDLWRATGVRTHFTTNLGVKELEERYGKRAVTRIFEMCDVFQMPTMDFRLLQNFKGFPPVYHPPTAEQLEWVEAYKKRMEEAQLKEVPKGNNSHGQQLREQFDRLLPKTAKGGSKT